MRLLIKTSSLMRVYRSGKGETAGEAVVMEYPAIEVGAGGIVAIIGKSGTGKSTLLNLLGGLDRPTPDPRSPASIKISLGAQTVDIVAKPEQYPRRHIGFIFQEGILFDDAPVALNVALPSVVNGLSITDEQIDGLLDEIGLARDRQFRSMRAWQLSGGEAQRVAFARAVAHDPQLLFVDEPTSSLDEDNAIALMSWLQRWTRERPDRTVLWVTHDLDLAARFADSVMVMGAAKEDTAQPLRPTAIPKAHSLSKSAEILKSWQRAGRVLEFDNPVPSTASAPETASTERDLGPDHADKMRRALTWRFVFAEMCAKRDKNEEGAGANTRDTEFTRWLGSTGQSRPGVMKVLWQLARRFSDWPQLSGITCASIILGIVLSTLVSGFRYHQDVMADPRNCHVVVTQVANLAADQGGSAHPLDKWWIDTYGDRRSWAGNATLRDPPSGYERFPADCASGTGIFGRRDFQPWEVGVFTGGPEICRGTGSSYRMMVTLENEPLLRTVRLIEPAALSQQYMNLKNYFYGGAFPDPLEMFISEPVAETIRKELIARGGAGPAGQLPEKICLMGIYDGQPPEVFRLRGVVSDLPAPRIARYDLLIREAAYQNLVKGGAVTLYSQLVFYFDPHQLEAATRFLDKNGLRYIPDTIATLSSKLAQIQLFWYASVVAFIVVISYIAINIGLSGVLFLQRNGRSLAVMKSFGFSQRFLLNIMLLRQYVLLSIAVITIVVIFAATYALLQTTLPEGGPWFEFYDGSRERIVWHVLTGFAGTVVVLVLFIPLICWWEIHKWWRRNRYVVDQLR
jgi:putative ABC transport system ATP-binding protein